MIWYLIIGMAIAIYNLKFWERTGELKTVPQERLPFMLLLVVLLWFPIILKNIYLRLFKGV